MFYNETRKLVLKGADAVVFVADSQPSMVDSTRESFANLIENLEVNQIDVNDTPIVIQFNKRDIPGVLSVEKLQEALGFEGYPYTEASAIKGEGVMETFKLVSKITAKHLLRRVKGRSGGSAEPAEPKKPAVGPKVAVKPVPAPEPEPEPATPTNPFADSVPFPESAPLDSGYEKMEEVSLESLISEGRERPATFSGTVPIPIPIMEEVEDLDADQLVAVADEPIAVAFDDQALSASPDSSAREGELASELLNLRGQVDVMKSEHRNDLKSLLRDIDALADRVRTLLES